MENKQIRKININVQRIYWTMQRLKNSCNEEKVIDYDKKLNEVLERGLSYARDTERSHKG